MDLAFLDVSILEREGDTISKITEIIEVSILVSALLTGTELLGPF